MALEGEQCQRCMNHRSLSLPLARTRYRGDTSGADEDGEWRRGVKVDEIHCKASRIRPTLSNGLGQVLTVHWSS